MNEMETPKRIWIDPHVPELQVFFKTSSEGFVEYGRIDPPAAPGYLHCSCGAACTEEEYAKHRAMGHEAGVPDEADKALAQGILHGFTLGYEVTRILERRALAALAQARKETRELAAGQVIDEAGKVGQLMNAAADSARKEERASVKSTVGDYFKHFPCTCVGAPRTGGHFTVCPITIRDEVLGRLEGLESASKQER